MEDDLLRDMKDAASGERTEQVYWEIVSLGPFNGKTVVNA
jgi:hypothetical protein